MLQLTYVRINFHISTEHTVIYKHEITSYSLYFTRLVLDKQKDKFKNDADKKREIMIKECDRFEVKIINKPN